MTNGYKLELISDGAGGAYPTYWDSLHGEDVSYHINNKANVTRRANNGQEELVVFLPAAILELLALLERDDFTAK